MSFPILTKEELLQKLQAAQMPLKFFDLHAIDTIGSCNYHTIKDDVQMGVYSFDHFIQAYTEMYNTNQLTCIHQVRSLANWLRVMEKSVCSVNLNIDSWSADIAYFAAAERSLQS